MIVKNPFRYGEPVTGEYFANRKSELKEITHDLVSGQNIILYSYRRQGKTSLIMEICELLREQPDIIACYVDLYGLMSPEEMAERIVNSIMLSAYPVRSALEKSLVRILRLIPNKITIMRGETRIELIFGRNVSPPQLEEAFELPQRVAEDKKKNMVIFFDEFQEINGLDGARIEKLARSKFQHHRRVSYLFAGSAVSVLREMFDTERRAFYRFGKNMTLSPIPATEFSEFIKNKFSSTGKDIEQDSIEYILEFTGGQPYATQQLCHELWYITEKKADVQLVKRAINQATIKQKDAFERQWDIIRSRHQKALLVGLSREPDGNIYSMDFIQAFGLASSAHVQKALKQLEKKRLLEGGKVTDVFFREWINQRVSHAF